MSQLNVPIPIVQSATSQQLTPFQKEVQMNNKVREYRGIIAMLLVHGVLMDTVEDAGDENATEGKAEVANMIADKLGVQAALGQMR